MLTLEEKRNRKSRGYITKSSFDQHPDSNSSGESGVPVRKRFGPLHGWDFKDCSWGVPAYNPRVQTDIIINLWPDYSSSLMLMLFVLLCKTWNVVKPGAWLARLPPGAQSQDFSPILPIYGAANLALTADRHSESLLARAVSRQVRSKVRGLLCVVTEA